MTDQVPQDEPDFGMTSDQGNRQVGQLLAEVAILVQRGEVGRREAVVALSDGVEALSADYPEVTDITVRTAVVAELDPVFVDADWERLDPYEF